MCRTLSASRRGWMKWRPGPRSRYLSDSLLSLSHKSAFYSVHSTAASHRSLQSGHRVGVGGLWRWHVRRELLMQVHLAVILTDTLPGWPDVCPGGLINTAQGRGQRRVWLDVGWERSAEMTGWLRPGLSQWQGRFAPALWGSPPPPPFPKQCPRIPVRYCMAVILHCVNFSAQQKHVLATLYRVQIPTR